MADVDTFLTILYVMVDDSARLTYLPKRDDAVASRR
jgi:hypothetical protein